MKKYFSILSLLLIFAACGGNKKVATLSTPTPEPIGVQFMKSESLTSVLEAAKKENKLIFIDFYTTWCLPCKLMDEEVFADEAFGDYMNDNFINYKVDAEKENGPSLSLIYQVIVFPTLLFIDGDGNVLTRKNGSAHKMEMKSLAEQAQAAYQASGE